MVISKVSSGRGAAWIHSAIGLVMDRPAIWIGGTAAAFGLAVVFSLIPFGNFLNQLLNFAMGLFFLSYARAQKQGHPFDFDQALKRVGRRLPTLIAMGLVNVLLFIICALPLFGSLAAVGGMEAIVRQQAEMPALSLGSTVAVALGSLISVLGGLVMLAATTFAMPLVLFQDKAVFAALGLSLKAVGRNLLPMIVFGILIVLLLLICVIPFGLGLLLGLPAVAASFYIAYEELLGRDDAL